MRNLSLERHHLVNAYEIKAVTGIIKQCDPCLSALSVRYLGTTKRALYTVSQKKLWSRTLAITLSNLNRFQKFLHCCKEKKISNKPCVITHGLLEISHHTLDMLLHYLVKYNNSKLTNYTRNTIKNVLIFKFDTIGIVARSTSY